MALTGKQQRFVDEYMIDLNATRAYAAAGYRGDENVCAVEGHKLLRNPKVAERVNAAMAERSQRTEITADYVINNLAQIVERCMERAPVMEGRGENAKQATDLEGRHVWEFNANGANKALELLGKHLKLFTDKVEHTGDVNVIVGSEDASL